MKVFVIFTDEEIFDIGTNESEMRKTFFDEDGYTPMDASDQLWEAELSLKKRIYPACRRHEQSLRGRP